MGGREAVYRPPDLPAVRGVPAAAGSYLHLSSVTSRPLSSFAKPVRVTR